MNQLTIFFDADCPFCTRCVRWLQEQPTYLKLRFIPKGSEQALAYGPPLAPQQEEAELVVLDDTGGVYVGDRAYIMCLYALKDYREWAMRLSEPHLAPLVKKAFGILTQHRHHLSKLFVETR